MEGLRNEAIDGQRPRGRSRRKGSRGAADRVSHKKASLNKSILPDTDGNGADAASWKAPEILGNRRRLMIAAVAGAGILLAAAGVTYGVMGLKYKNVYYPNTIVNGIDVSGRTPEQAKEMIAAGIKGYTLSLTARTGDEIIAGSDIDLHPEYDGSLEYILSSQKPLLWGQSLMKEVSYTIAAMTAYDEEKLQEAVSGLSCMNPEQMEAPEDARLSDYIAGVGYEIIPEKQGSKLDEEKLLQGIAEAIANLQPRLSLEELDVYEKPQVTSEDETLQQRLAALNQYARMTVTYLFGSQKEVLDGDAIHQWISMDEQGNVQVDEAQIAEYVKQLGKKYNTAYQPKQLKTSYGETVTITKGNYGWRINQKEETAALAQIIRSGQGQEREPAYLQKAASYEGPDYGNTYVEINLTAQHLYFYKNGQLLVESDFVSGNEARGYSTPAGAYPLTYKERNATLRGQGYASPVSYWMPFNGGIGMHDASWRSSFGGKIYKTNGSHGCINLPAAAAKTIYENIEAGMPVLCYHLGGTEAASSTSSSGTAKPAQPETAAASETTAAVPDNPSVPETSPASPGGTPAQGSTPAGNGSSSSGSDQSVPEKPTGQQSSVPEQTVQQPGTNQAGPGQGGTAAQPGTAAGGQESSGTVTQPGTSSGGTGAVQTPPGGASAGPGGGTAGPSGSSGGVQTQEIPGGGVQTSPTPGGSASSGPGGQSVPEGPGASSAGPGM